MSTVKINNKNYEVPELTFAHSKRLEQFGVPLRRLIDPDLMFTIVSAFVALVANVDPESADYLIEQHILGGGNLEDIYKAYIDAISESHFFQETPGESGEQNQDGESGQSNEGNDTGRIEINSFSDAIDKIWFPAAIRYGIPFDTFWKLNPKYMEMYQKEYLDGIKSKYEFADFQAWKQGEYMIAAIQMALEPKKAKYPDKPYSMSKSDELQTHPEIQARKFEDWANAFNKKFISRSAEHQGT